MSEWRILNNDSRSNVSTCKIQTGKVSTVESQNKKQNTLIPERKLKYSLTNVRTVVKDRNIFLSFITVHCHL